MPDAIPPPPPRQRPLVSALLAPPKQQCARLTLPAPPRPALLRPGGGAGGGGAAALGRLQAAAGRGGGGAPEAHPGGVGGAGHWVICTTLFPDVPARRLCWEAPGQQPASPRREVAWRGAAAEARLCCTPSGAVHNAQRERVLAQAEYARVMSDPRHLDDILAKVGGRIRMRRRRRRRRNKYAYFVAA